MKIKEREQSRLLRKKGWSLNAISKEVGCSKGTISLWIRDIPLTRFQIANLKSAQDKGRAKAANHPNSSKSKWNKIRTEIENQKQAEIPLKPTNADLKMVCAALYWAEGYKKGNALFVFANSDPDMIQLMVKFLVDVCKVPVEKLRGRVNIAPDLDVKDAEKYWSRISHIPTSQFHKPLLAVSKSSKQRRKTLPFGTFRVIISSVYFCSEFRGWINGLKLWTSSSVG